MAGQNPLLVELGIYLRLEGCATYCNGSRKNRLKDLRHTFFQCHILFISRSKAKRASISRAQESHLDCFNEAATSDVKWGIRHLVEKILKALSTKTPGSSSGKLELNDVEQRRPATQSTCQCHDTSSGNQYLSFHTQSAFHQQTDAALDYHQVASNPTSTLSAPSSCNQKRLHNQGTSEAVFQISSRLPFNVSAICCFKTTFLHCLRY